MDRGVWGATVHVVTESQIQLSDYYFHFQNSIYLEEGTDAQREEMSHLRPNT